MKNQTVCFLVIVILFFIGCKVNEPINPPIATVKQYIVEAKSGSNGIISPRSLVVDSGRNAQFTMIPENGYMVDVLKVNGTVVPLTSLVYILSNFTSDTTNLFVTFKKIKETVKYKITASGDINGTITPAVAVVDSGKSATFDITSNPGCRLKEFKVDGIVVPLTSNRYTIASVNSDKKLESTFEEVLSDYFFGKAWRQDSIYSRPIGGTYTLWVYAYPDNFTMKFFSDGICNINHGDKIFGTGNWSVDKTTNPNILTYGNDFKVELLTKKKLILSHLEISLREDGSVDSIYEFYVRYVPFPE